MTEPRTYELHNEPDFQLKWVWRDQDGNYIAGFFGEKAALAYGRLKGWVE